MAKQTKTEIAIEILRGNQGKCYAELIEMIAKQCDLSEKNARVCYALRVKADPSLGSVPARPVKAAAPKLSVKAPKAATKVSKAPKAEKASAPVKSLDEIAKIKAANLARMKAVSEKTRKYNQVARPEGAGVPNFDPEKAQGEVAAFLDTGDIDSFAAPEKLSADQVRALV